MYGESEVSGKLRTLGMTSLNPSVFAIVSARYLQHQQERIK